MTMRWNSSNQSTMSKFFHHKERRAHREKIDKYFVRADRLSDLCALCGKFFFFAMLVSMASCYRVTDSIDPHVSWQLQDRHLQGLKSAFGPFTPEEKSADWSKECV